MHLNKISPFLLLLFAFASAETTLSGKIGGMSLDSAGSPHIVTGDIFVEKGKTLTLKAGCVLLFHPFTGISIEGNLIAEGAKNNPVVFSSINDFKYNDTAREQPQPFDWNGITIAANSGETNLSNFILCYSTIGLKTQNENIAIEGGVFHSNGQYNLTIKGSPLNVTENFPFNYSSGEKKQDSDSLPQKKSIRKLLSIVCGSAGLASLGASAFFLSRKFHYQAEYKKAVPQSEMDAFFEKQKDASQKSVIFGVTGGILVTAGIVLYVSDGKGQEKRLVSLQPCFGAKNGLTVSLSF